jgi:hypothetical protein
MRAEPFKGRVKIDRRSSLRKLMRAARRGRIPDERQTIIDTATESAMQRRAEYANSFAKSWGRY